MNSQFFSGGESGQQAQGGAENMGREPWQQAGGTEQRRAGDLVCNRMEGGKAAIFPVSDQPCSAAEKADQSQRPQEMAG